MLAVAAQRALTGVGARAFDAGAFWAVAARRAALARIVCDHASPAHSSETFTAALLLDCAVPVLAGAFGDQYRAVIDFYFGNASPDGATITRLESEGVGADHAQAGALLAASWGLPDGLVRAIRMQHVPDASPADLRAALKLVVDQGIGSDREDRARFAREATSLVGLPAARAEEAFERSLIDSVELARTLAA